MYPPTSIIYHLGLTLVFQGDHPVGIPGPTTASKVLHNPYAKSNRKQSQPLPSSLSSGKNKGSVNNESTTTTRQTFGAKRRTSSTTGISCSTTEQYPHRVGRRRRTHQDFGLSLRLEDGTDDSEDENDDDDELLSFVAFRK